MRLRSFFFAFLAAALSAEPAPADASDLLFLRRLWRPADELSDSLEDELSSLRLADEDSESEEEPDNESEPLACRERPWCLLRCVESRCVWKHKHKGGEARH